MAFAAGFIAEEEPWGLPGFGQGGGDILVQGYQEGVDAIADITVINEQRDDVVEQASVQDGHVARTAEAAKRQRYGQACDQLGMSLLPLALEIDGAFGETLMSFLKVCRQRTSDMTKTHPGLLPLLRNIGSSVWP